jgi:hypothetical protein
MRGLDHRLVATSDISSIRVDQTLETSFRPRISEALRGCFLKNPETIWTSAMSPKTGKAGVALLSSFCGETISHRG